MTNSDKDADAVDAAGQDQEVASQQEQQEEGQEQQDEQQQQEEADGAEMIVVSNETETETETEGEEDVPEMNHELLGQMTLQDVVDWLSVNLPLDMFQPLALQIQSNFQILNFLEDRKLLAAAFPETPANGQETEAQETGDEATLETQQQDDGDDDAVEMQEEDQQDEADQEDGDQETDEDEGQQDEAAGLEAEDDEPVVEEVVKKKPGRPSKKAAAAAKKPTKAVEEVSAKAKKPAAKKGKAKQQQEEESVAVIDLAKVAGGKAAVAKARKSLGDANPQKTVKALGFSWPKAVKTEGEVIELAALVVAAHTKLSGMKPDALVELAEKHGIEIKFGRTRKDEAKVDIAVKAIVQSYLAELG